MKWGKMPKTPLASLQYSALLHVFLASAEACHALWSSSYFKEEGPSIGVPASSKGTVS